MKVTNEAQSGGSILWLCLTFLAFIIALGLSWLFWIPLNFGYESLYGLIDIDQHIARYAPMNQTKFDFALTAESQRYRLFADIVTAIHQQGEGLQALSYLDGQGQSVALLTHDEVVHLQDVAILIDRMKWFVLGAIILFIVLFVWLFKHRIAMPSFRSLLAYTLIALLLVTGLILLIGAHDVFYQLHVWAFPDDHKWFFFYEESLMSTMMKAPDLFAYIAALLVAVALVIFIIIMWVLRQLFIRRVANYA